MNIDTCLPEKDIKLFYKLHPALLQYVNLELRLFPEIKTVKALRNSGIKNIATVQEKLWEKPIEYIDKFIAKNPFNLSKEEHEIIDQWKNAVIGTFYIFRHSKKYTIFLNFLDGEEIPKSYSVHSLYTPLYEMFPFPPVYTKATLLPFRDHIIYDGVLYPYSVTFGGGIRRNLNKQYQKSKKKFGVITQLT